MPISTLKLSHPGGTLRGYGKPLSSKEERSRTIERINTAAYPTEQVLLDSLLQELALCDVA